MMTRPSTAQIVDLVRESLDGMLALTSQEQTELLLLADGLLGVVGRRAELDSSWMLEEIAEIEEFATFLLFNGHDPDGVIRDKHALCVPADQVRPDQVAEAYRSSSELLMSCVRLAMNAGGAARSRLDAVINSRVAHERGIRGDVAIVRG